jgi:hypothetical protein
LSHFTSSCRQLSARYGGLTRPLCSSRITGLHRSYRAARPSAPLRSSRLAVDAACASPLASERLVPAVPRENPDQSHVPYTPAAARPMTKRLTSLSQEMETPLVLTASLWITTRHRGFTFVRLSDPHLLGVCPRRFDPNAHHHDSLPQQLGLVWSPLLEADSEGPAFISHAALTQSVSSSRRTSFLRAPAAHFRVSSAPWRRPRSPRRFRA